MTSSRCLEITVISGEGLRINGKRVKKNAFVTVRTDAYNFQATKVDKEGGSYPFWNENLKIPMPATSRFLTVEVHCGSGGRGLASNNLVGAANIPFSDFVGGYVPEYCLQFLSYRLRDSKGDRNGIINISVRVNLPESAGFAAANYSRPHPVCGSALAAPVFGTVSSGVVTGVPVWSAGTRMGY